MARNVALNHTWPWPPVTRALAASEGAGFFALGYVHRMTATGYGQQSGDGDGRPCGRNRGGERPDGEVDENEAGPGECGEELRLVEVAGAGVDIALQMALKRRIESVDLVVWANRPSQPALSETLAASRVSWRMASPARGSLNQRRGKRMVRAAVLPSSTFSDAVPVPAWRLVEQIVENVDGAAQRPMPASAAPSEQSQGGDGTQLTPSSRSIGDDVVEGE